MIRLELGVDNLEQAVLDLINTPGNVLDMSVWEYGLECRRKGWASWVIHARGEMGVRLADDVGVAKAAFYISIASGADIPETWYYDEDTRMARRRIRAKAEWCKSRTTGPPIRKSLHKEIERRRRQLRKRMDDAAKRISGVD